MKILVTLMILPFSFFAQASPMAMVEGASISQKKINWVWKHKKTILSSCLNETKDCGIKDLNHDVLMKLHSYLKKNLDLKISFISEKINPDLFKSDAGETHRTAVTSNKPGSLIYVNDDRISVLSFAQITSLIFHELTHHLGYVDDTLRLPDLIGSRVAKHFNKRLVTSAYDDAVLPNLLTGVIQTEVTNLSADPATSSGFLTDGSVFIDINFAKFEISPACNSTLDELVGQTISGGLNLLQHDYLQAESKIKNLCYSVADKNKYLTDRVFMMRFKLDAANQIALKSIQTILDFDRNVSVDSHTTLQLIAGGFDKPVYKSGEKTSATVKLKSFAGQDFDSCIAGIADANNPIKPDGYPIMEDADCTITSNIDGVITVAVGYQVTPLEKKGNRYIPMVRLFGKNGQPDAVADLRNRKISYYSESSSNLNNELKIVSIKPNLPALNFKTQAPLKNSYIYDRSHDWYLDVAIKSTQPVTFRGIETQLLMNVDGRLAQLDRSGSLHHLSDLFLIENTSVSDGIFRFRIKVTIPKSYSGYETFGLAIKLLIFQDESKNFIEFKHDNEYDFWIISNELKGTI